MASDMSESFIYVEKDATFPHAVSMRFRPGIGSKVSCVCGWVYFLLEKLDKKAMRKIAEDHLRHTA
jgi:hypothetical protein